MKKRQSTLKERRINIRVLPEFYAMLDAKRFADKTSWQDIGMSLLTAWYRGEMTYSAPVAETPVIGSELSDAILKLDDARNILDRIRHDLTKGGSVPATADHLSREARELLEAPTEHPGPVKDLGTGTGQPAGWRKGYRKNRPDQSG